MTDWNPDDPDATRVYYDLEGWTFDQQAELASALAEVEIPHSWVGTELVVPEDFEQQCDELIDDVEHRLGIENTGANTRSDASGPAVLDPDAPITEFDLDEWEATERLKLSHALTSAEIGYRWAGSVLEVSTLDESVVDALLDDIESGEYVDVSPAAQAEAAAEALPAELLTTFFLAGERLRNNPLDPDGLEQLLAATDVADESTPPFGVQPRLWAQTVELADRVADALADDDVPDLDAVMAAAAELHDLLRPHV
jgi:hypothetical protein